VSDDVWLIATDADKDADIRRLNTECARLTAIANEMAAVLLAVEWDGGMCPSCGGTRDRHEEDGHADDCALDTCLTKAGVR